MKGFSWTMALSLPALLALADVARAEEPELEPLISPSQTSVVQQSQAEEVPRTQLSPAVGFGWSTEDGQADPSLHFRLSLEAAHRFSHLFSVRARARDHFYRRQYLTDRPAVDSEGLARAEVNEQKLDLEAFATFDVARALTLPGAFRVTAGVGPSFRIFINETLPSQSGAPALEVRAGYALSHAVELQAGGGYAYNVLFDNAALASAVGGPLSYVGLNAALAFQFPPDARVMFAWDAELLQLQRSVRQYHSVSFVLELSL